MKNEQIIQTGQLPATRSAGTCGWEPMLPAFPTFHEGKEIWLYEKTYCFLNFAANVQKVRHLAVQTQHIFVGFHSPLCNLWNGVSCLRLLTLWAVCLSSYVVSVWGRRPWTYPGTAATGTQRSDLSLSRSQSERGTGRCDLLVFPTGSSGGWGELEETPNSLLCSISLVPLIDISHSVMRLWFCDHNHPTWAHNDNW